MTEETEGGLFSPLPYCLKGMLMDVKDIRRRIKVFNTLTKKVERFEPQGDEVKMYVCGLTPYDYAHIGHARTYVFFDTFVRFLRYVGYKVKYVQNFTDVDDKIIARALEEGKRFDEISKRFEEEYFKDMDVLHVKRADVYPRVSEHIEDISKIIEGLKEKNIAYEIEDGIYYHVPSFKEYGKLSHQSLEELNKHRIEPNPQKRDKKDFSLWKFKKREDEQVGAVFFPSCCKSGRPGWHIECSAMSMRYLGETLDIHGGGKDLIFPHHENEIAQSEAYTGKPFTRYWMHVHFVNIKGEKMSKSLKNFIRIRDALSLYSPITLRIFLLSVHYRKDLDYNEKALNEAQETKEYLENALNDLLFEINYREVYKAKANSESKLSLKDRIEEIRERFLLSLAEDMKTNLALKEFRELAKLINQNASKMGKEGLEHALLTFKECSSLLGLWENIEKWSLKEEHLKLIEKRSLLRKQKKYEEADKIREKLAREGIFLKDEGERTIWIIVRDEYERD